MEYSPSKVNERNLPPTDNPTVSGGTTLRKPGSPIGLHWLRHLWLVAAWSMMLFLTIPVLVLVTSTTTDQLVSSLRQPQLLQAVFTSLKTTLFSLTITILLGTPLAYLLGRHQFRMRHFFDTMLDLPTVLPPAVAGLALLMTFGRRGVLGEALSDLGLEIAFTQTAVVMAQIFVAAPFFVRTASLGFAGINREIEQAAELDGASRWQVFRYVLFPLSRLSLITGAALCWARALGEFGATILFAGNFPGRTQTMPLAIYLGFESKLEVALTLSVILLVISFLTLFVVKRLAARSSRLED